MVKAFLQSPLLIILILILTLGSACKKSTENVTESILEQYFEQNILNRDFIVKLAVDSTDTITSQFDGYKFKLFKNTLYDGPMTATKNGLIYNGTWSSNSDYGQLIITLPSSPADFFFLNRSWRFTRKAIPVMELAPWGTTDPKILQMERQ